MGNVLSGVVVTTWNQIAVHVNTWKFEIVKVMELDVVPGWSAIIPLTSITTK